MSAVRSNEAGTRGSQRHGKRFLKKDGHIDTLVAKRVELALSRLRESGRLKGESSKKLSVRVDPGLVSAAAERIGADNPTDVINTALALMASPDPFVQWFLTTKDKLPEDFELAV
ncbi:MAG TPA: hypothetical protein VK943_16560 [Arenibaculum sp.]|nr:hypothetical protein [Arenibaculum sp.]